MSKAQRAFTSPPLSSPPPFSLRHGSTVRCLRILLRSKLVHHDNSK